MKWDSLILLLFGAFVVTVSLDRSLNRGVQLFWPKSPDGHVSRKTSSSPRNPPYRALGKMALEKMGSSFSRPCSWFKSFSCVLKHPKWAYYASKPVENASFAGGEDWKVVAERMGFTAPEIRFLDHRTRNPFEAALAHYIDRNPMKVDDLYDILTECGMPVLADIL